ncbi:hypothetical protein PM082_004507 [Marasmius tenuissimus]|nr:hypothetical protein PM082_004507 [Marasmius tenuissimus]
MMVSGKRTTWINTSTRGVKIEDVRDGEADLHFHCHPRRDQHHHANGQTLASRDGHVTRMVITIITTFVRAPSILQNLPLLFVEMDTLKIFRARLIHVTLLNVNANFGTQRRRTLVSTRSWR